MLLLLNRLIFKFCNLIKLFKTNLINEIFNFIIYLFNFKARLFLSFSKLLTLFKRLLKFINRVYNKFLLNRSFSFFFT